MVCVGGVESRARLSIRVFFFVFQAEDGIRDNWRDWSSDVCSSDLLERALGALRTVKASGAEERERDRLHTAAADAFRSGVRAAKWEAIAGNIGGLAMQLAFITDRKSVVVGKSVDLGGRRIIKKKKK